MKYDISFEKDGLLFYHRDGIYISGTSDLFMTWKDESCSKYVINTDKAGRIPPHQVICMNLTLNKSFMTRS